MKQEHIEEGVSNPALGPAYFSARETAEQFMEKFQNEHFEKLAKTFTDKFYEEVQTSLDTFLLSDAQSNFQSALWRDVDAVVNAIVGGEQWALQRYVLRDNISCETARETIAKLIPQELQDGRIADLEEEVRNLKSSLQMYRDRY